MGLISQSPIYYRSLLAPNGVTQATWDNQVKLYYKLVYSNNRNQNNTKLDGEPDIFQFEFGNFRGSFVFGNDRIPVMIPYQNIKIEVPYSFDKNGGISSSDSWIFTTPDGTKYEFINSSDYTENAPKGYTSAIHGAMSFDYISQWNLSSITTIDDNIYNFSYENDNIINISSIMDYMQFAISGEPGSIGPEDFSVTVQNDISIKRLTQISSSFGRINFYKSLTPRLDFTNQYSVSSIKKYNNN